jgi:5-methylcytosine-specific restriction endonuclease McrA
MTPLQFRVTPWQSCRDEACPHMTWRGPRTANDPVLTSPAWRKLRADLKAEWSLLGLPCARCGRAIDYTGPRYHVLLSGRRTVNRRALIIGHKISRSRAPALALERTNLQPECVDCSNRSGALLGQRVQRRRQATVAALNTSRRW